MQTPGEPIIPASPLTRFLQSLSMDGQAAITAEPLSGDAETALDMLRQIDLAERVEMAFEAPRFSESSAIWGARLFFQLCQFVVCRDVAEKEITMACQTGCPRPRCPETDWSVDLTLRHLPKLFSIAKHLSQADPLLENLKNLGRQWALSSVGMTGLFDLQIDSFIADPSLRRLYADRIVAENDLSRLGDPRVDDLLRADLSIHHYLAPLLASRLFPASPIPSLSNA
jgi:hypothetical protein